LRLSKSVAAVGTERVLDLIAFLGLSSVGFLQLIKVNEEKWVRQTCC
jgi:hypothetical protein